jgi:hypothetical protein
MTHDPGGKVLLPLREGWRGGATFSQDGRHRPTLWRQKVTRGLEEPKLGTAMWIGMNPSTADVDVDDPTVSREVGFTDRWGYRSYLKVNVSSYRATNPRDLPADGSACPRSNLDGIIMNAPRMALVVLAWGVPPKPLRASAATLLHELRRRKVPLFCLGTTREGHPRHPLYIKSDTPLIPFPEAT